MRYLHILAAVVSAFLAYPVYLRHGLGYAWICILGVAANLIIFIVEDRK